MIRKLKRQPWPWPLSISVTYTCGIRSRAANGLKDPLMEKKRNLIELGTSIQFSWESDNISKHHKTKHCDWMSWDATEMKRHDKASTHRPSSPLRQLLFHAFGVICPSPLFNTTSSEFLTVPNNNLRGLRCLLRKGRPRRGSWCWWNRRVESCLIDGINIDHLKLSTGDAIQPCTNKDVKKTGQQSWS